MVAELRPTDPLPELTIGGILELGVSRSVSYVFESSHPCFTLKLNSYSNASIFYRFVACAFPFFEVKSVLPIDRYQNATSNAISQHELKKVQERYTLVTQDSIGHLKTLCMSVLLLVVALESEWKCYSSSQSDKKMLVFEYEFSLRVGLV